MFTYDTNISFMLISDFQDLHYAATGSVRVRGNGRYL